MTFNITDYGAVHNGNPSVNRASIQSAIDAAGSRGLIHSPAGIYPMDQGVHCIHSDVSFKGDGPQTSIWRGVGDIPFDILTIRNANYNNIGSMGFDNIGIPRTAIKYDGATRGLVEKLVFSSTVSTGVLIGLNSSWMRLSHLHGTGVGEIIKVDTSLATDANQNPTGMVVSNLTGSVSIAALHATGRAFGDWVINNINIVGLDPSAVGIRLDGADVGRLYAHRILVNNVDFDGTGQYSLFADNCDFLRITNVVKGGGITGNAVQLLNCNNCNVRE